METILINAIRSLVEIPDNQIKALRPILTHQSIKKGDYFVKAGEIPKRFGFVLKGLFRYYYLTQDGKDFTKGFIAENDFVSSYSAMILNRESYFWIEAMEDSSVILINYKNWQKLVKSHGCWDSLLKIFLEKVFIKKENREKEFLLDNAETRYKTFLSEYPKLEQRIKQHHIASYLGITPVALSRIRKKLLT